MKEWKQKQDNKGAWERKKGQKKKKKMEAKKEVSNLC